VTDLPAIGSRLDAVLESITEACRPAGRDPGDVTLIGVTKTVPVERIAQARAEGLVHFGENRARDLAEKAPRIEATWHFIGKLQTGTANRVADHADVLHSAEPGSALDRLSRRLSKAGRTMPALVEVDFTGRRQGVAPEDVEAFVEEATGVEGIRLIGLMTIPPMTPAPEGARPYFTRLRELRDRVCRDWPEVRELSMGMSADYRIAVEEGATMVRVGTALFGQRPDPGRG
jgi:pyridoxal phosphate enzyme (YggS family)